MSELLPADELNARYDPMNRDELIAECERLRELLSIAQDRNAEHCAEVQRLERVLKDIIALTTGPDRGSAAWQIEAAVEIAQSALTRRTPL